MPRTNPHGDEIEPVIGDAETDRRLDRIARARGRDPNAVAAELVRYGLTHVEDALD